MERDRVTAGVSPDASPTRFRFYSRSLPVPASGLGPHGALRPLPGAGARRAPSRVGGGPGGRRERTLGDGGCDPAQPGTRRGGCPVSGGPWTPRGPRRSRRVAAGPRPGLAPSPWRRVRQEPLRFVSRCFSHGRSASLLPPFAPPASLSIGETERRRRWVSGLATPRREDDVVPALPTRAASCASSGWGGPGGGMSPLAATSRSRDGLAWLGGRRLFSDPALPLER